jgi:hypothetical protein
MILRLFIITSLSLALELFGCAQQITKNEPGETLVISSTPASRVNDESKVIIRTCVRWNGEVISTEFQPDLSSVTDTSLINKAILAAKNYKFEVVQGSPDKCGNLTFKFKLKK